MHRPHVALWLLALLACAGDEPKDTDVSDTDADSDTDSDTDTDADTDTDTDTDADTDTGTRTEPADLANCLSVDETDRGNNGSIEVVTTSVYDGFGLLATVEVDDTDPDTPRDVIFVRDAAGNELERQFDNDGDGDIDDIFFATFNAAGELASYCVDYGNDGTCNYEEQISFDATTGLRSLYEVDSDGDGVFESSCTYTYDGQDRRLGYVCDGALDRTATYTYTEVTVYDYLQEVDLGSNGSIDQSYDYRFQDETHPIYVGSDTNGNGSWDTELTTTYNADGTIDEIEGLVAQPAALFRYIYVYEAEGYVSRLTFGIDVTGDGLADDVTVDEFTWTCP